MSLINEALKRAERDKQLGRSPYFNNFTVLTPTEEGPSQATPTCRRFDSPRRLTAIAAAFVIAGDGNLRTAIEHRAYTSAIADRCRFLGHRNDIHAILNASDALVLSSRNEGLGLTLIEAMACAVPVVATDVGGVRAVLQDGRCGLLVPPTSATPRDLANAVVRIAGDQTLRRNLILAGLARSKDFDLAAVVRRFADIYEELAAQ